jgi:hypothetical protein
MTVHRWRQADVKSPVPASRRAHEIDIEGGRHGVAGDVFQLGGHGNPVGAG